MKKFSSLHKILITIIISLIIIPALLNAQQRKIKPGDTIEIIVYGHQELSRTVEVSPQGTVEFPYMQNIPVDGQTLEKIRELIVARLKLILPTPPVVTASFVKTSNISINVLGHVGMPGLVELQLNSRLQGAIFKAGNFLPGAIAKSVTLIRNEKGETTTDTYNLELFIYNGDLQQNPVLKDEDIVIVTGNPIFAQVKVMGGVNRPGTYNPSLGASVIDLIFMAGGFTGNADLKKIKYISSSEKEASEIEIDLSEYFKAQQTNVNIPTVKEGDIIIVPIKKKNLLLITWGIFKEVLSITQALYWIYLIRRYNN